MTSLAREKRDCQRTGQTDRRVSWIAHGKRASVEFWIQVGHYGIMEHQDYKGEPCWPGGFEVHARQGEGDPSQTNCTVLGGQCWHDGSSLSASEFFERWGQDDETAFAECGRWLADYEVGA